MPSLPRPHLRPGPGPTTTSQSAPRSRQSPESVKALLSSLLTEVRSATGHTHHSRRGPTAGPRTRTQGEWETRSARAAAAGSGGVPAPGTRSAPAAPDITPKRLHSQPSTPAQSINFRRLSRGSFVPQPNFNLPARIFLLRLQTIGRLRRSAVDQLLDDWAAVVAIMWRSIRYRSCDVVYDST
jgi:hypothetical protein